MVIDWGVVLLIGLGILLGGIAFSASFRKKFFVGLRNFIWGKGKKSSGQKSEDESDNKTKTRRIRTIHMVTCPTCKGKKRVPKKLPAIADQRLAPMTICPTCEGSGEVEEGTVEE